MLENQVTNREWSFADAPNTAVYTTRDIIEGGNPILIVTHDQDDGAWQFRTVNTTQNSDGRITALGEIAFRDPSVIELFDLPIGWMAMRHSTTGPWVRQPILSTSTAEQLTEYDDSLFPAAVASELQRVA